MDKNITLKNFKINTYAWDAIEEEGRWDQSWKKWSINYSSILSRLIVEAGKYCESFASDLFIFWNEIDKNLGNIDYCGGTYLFGFRQYGVDSNSFVLSNYRNSGKFAEYIYRSLWRLDVTVEDNNITMKFGRCF